MGKPKKSVKADKAIKKAKKEKVPSTDMSVLGNEISISHKNRPQKPPQKLQKPVKKEKQAKTARTKVQNTFQFKIGTGMVKVSNIGGNDIQNLIIFTTERRCRFFDQKSKCKKQNLKKRNHDKNSNTVFLQFLDIIRIIMIYFRKALK